MNLAISSELATLAILLFIVLFIGIFFFMYLSQSRKNAELQDMLLNVAFKSNFSDRRADMEERLISLNKPFQENAADFSDINHLALRAQKLSEENDTNDFIKSLGLDPQNIEIDEKRIFVLTPFSDAETETFAHIRKILDRSGYRILRGDEQERSDIFSHIIKNIMEAKVVIANLNGRNPNVMYELGIAHMLDKPVLMIAEMQENWDDLPFDVRAKHIILYRTKRELRDKLLNGLLQVI